MTRRRAAQDELRRRATHDPLTGLPNRHAMHERLAEAVAEARATGRPGAVLFCDLDGFKQVNDQYGHISGDRVLVVIARRLTEVSRSKDAVGRLGGDEFVVVASDLDAEQSERLAARLRLAVEHPVTIDGMAVQVGLSVGVAVVSGDSGDVADVLRRGRRGDVPRQAAPDESNGRGGPGG